MRILWGCSPRGLYNFGVRIGQARGILTYPGTTCELFENLTGADYTELLVKGRFDLGTCGTPPLFAALERTSEYAVVASANNLYPPFYLIAHPSIKAVAELGGRTIAINKFRTCLDSVVCDQLSRVGVPRQSVQIIEVVQTVRYIEAMQKGDIQAAILWEPWVSYAERVLGWHVLVDCPRDVKPSNYAYLIYARRSLIKNHQDVVKGYVLAYMASMQYAKDHLDELLELDYPFDLVSREDVARAIQRELPLWNTDPAFDWNILRTAEKELKLQGVVRSEFDIASFLVSLSGMTYQSMEM
jgi:ABC-type nitrate/sulfonate/bicarbonate transport system substrate-binding protein